MEITITKTITFLACKFPDHAGDFSGWLTGHHSQCPAAVPGCTSYSPSQSPTPSKLVYLKGHIAPYEMAATYTCMVCGIQQFWEKGKANLLLSPA